MKIIALVAVLFLICSICDATADNAAVDDVAVDDVAVDDVAVDDVAVDDVAVDGDSAADDDSAGDSVAVDDDVVVDDVAVDGDSADSAGDSAAVDDDVVVDDDSAVNDDVVVDDDSAVDDDVVVDDDSAVNDDVVVDDDSAVDDDVVVDGGDFVRSSSCKKAKSCYYEYTASTKIKGGEKIDITANVDIFCQSVGVFKGQKSIRHCINVRDTVVRTKNEKKKYDAEDVVPVNDLGKWFCFAQSSSTGKILGVFHDKKDNKWAVNFKKNIASAFQANYKGTAVTDETDSQSKHKSHYKYYAEGNKYQIQERRIDTRDVSAFAGKTESTDSKSSLYFHEHDKIELDNEKRVQFSKGKAVLELGPDQEEKASTASSKNDNDKGIPALGAVSNYKLKLSRCTAQTNKKEVAEVTAALASPESMSDGLLASMDEDKANEEEMEDLADDLPSFDETVKRVQRDVESEETLQLITDWRRMLELESKKGPLSGTEAKLPQLLQRLEELQGMDDESSSSERVLIYHLLSSEGSLTSQQALVDSMVYAPDSSEVTSLSVEIALLPRVDSSTIDSLLSQYESFDPDGYVSNQLILSIATLGRHENVEEKIVNYLSKKLSSTKSPEETSLFIHALGNTGSKRIIPLLLPFLSDPVNEGYCVDALRAVSMDERVEKGFAAIISEADPQLVLEVVESLLFPFKNSIYSSQIKKDLVVSEELKTSLIEAGIKTSDDELTKTLIQYFTAIEDEASSEKLRQGIEDKASTSRGKRGSSTYWASRRDNKYNLIESASQRSRDVRTYPYNRGYLWTKQIGYSKIHAKIAAGGFGGVGIPGIKLYARARVDLVAWSRTYTALDIIFSYLRVFPDRNSVSTLTYRRYIKIVGYTLLNEQRTTRSVYKYTRSWYKSVLLFRTRYAHFIYVGIMHMTVSGYIRGRMTFQAYIARMDNDKNMKATAQLKTGPRLIITGAAVANIMRVFKVGLRVSGSIGYFVTPEASISVCGRSPKGDANACFEVFNTINGRISVEAYWRKRQVRCRWSWRGPRCSTNWTGKNRYGPLSRRWNLYNRRRKLFGLCRVCDCYGNYFLNVLCKGRRVGASTCRCNTRYTG